LASVALTDQLALKIATDTQTATNEKIRTREIQMAHLSKTREVVSAYAAVGGAKERHVSPQDLRESMPDSFESRDAKWKHFPYYALQRVFEFHGEWGLSRVSRRWYDGFMNYDFEFEAKTQWLLRAMSKCVESITVSVPGWSEEHSSFWRKLTRCHSNTISLLIALPTIPTDVQQGRPYVLRRMYNEWVLHQVVRPCFAIRDRVLLDHLYRNFDDQVWIRRTMKLEFYRMARTFMELRRFPLFLHEYGHLMEEFGLTPAMMDKIMKLPAGEGSNPSEEGTD